MRRGNIRSSGTARKPRKFSSFPFALSCRCDLSVLLTEFPPSRPGHATQSPPPAAPSRIARTSRCEFGGAVRPAAADGSDEGLQRAASARWSGRLRRKLDRQSVHVPHYKQGLVLCSLEIKDKLFLFLRDAVDPETVLARGLTPGSRRRTQHDPTFGQGAEGYGKRLVVSYTDESAIPVFQGVCLSDDASRRPALLPDGTELRQAPIPPRRGPLGGRLYDHGSPMFNYSEWLGEVSGDIDQQSLPSRRQARRWLPRPACWPVDVALDIGYDELREFWPEIARKFKLPFRDQNEPPLNALPPDGSSFRAGPISAVSDLKTLVAQRDSG